MSSNNFHVLIAGAGPVGLLAAINLCQRGIRVTMVERETRERLVVHTNGAGFMMYTCSNYILKRLGLYEKTIAVSRELESIQIMGPGDKTIKEYDVLEEIQRDTPLGKIRGSTSTARFVLAKIFLDELEKYEKEGLFDIHFKTQVSEYERVGKYNVVLMAKKGEEDVKFEGNLLFGCDGIHSLIRKQMMQDMKIADDYLVDSGLTAFWGKYEENEDKSNTKDLPMDAFISKDGESARNYVKMGGPKDPSYFSWGYGPASADEQKTGIAWSYITRTSEEKRSDFDAFKKTDGEEVDLNNRGARKGEAVRTELLERAEKNSYLETVVNNTDAPRILKASLLYHKRMDAPYVFGRVCLLGDACHPVSPGSGQGLNMGLVDAYVLPLYITSALKEGPSHVSRAIREYADLETRKIIEKFAMETFRKTEIAMAKNPFVYGIMKPMMKMMNTRAFLRTTHFKAEELNFGRVYKAEQFADSAGVKNEAVLNL